MNYSNLCYGCFREKSLPDEKCPHCGYNNASPQISVNCLRAGTVLNNRYIVGRALGVGGFGITYKCLDMKVGGICAIKEYFPSSFCARMSGITAVEVSESSLEKYKKIMRRFVEEAELLKTLHHRNIITVYDSFFGNNTAYYVMEYCDGIDLRNYTNQFRRRLDYGEGMNILYQTLNGMEYIHSKGILHRDIAPDNIFITKNDVVKLLDFGSARREMDQVNRNLSVIIKAGYAPVEQYGGYGKQGTFTDIYGFGATFYHLFTGIMPLESTNRVYGDKLIPFSRLRPDLPDELKYCIERSMRVSASERIQSVSEIKRILRISNAARSDRVVKTVTDADHKEEGDPHKNKHDLAAKGRKIRRATVSERVCAYMIDLMIYGLIYSGIVLLTVTDSDIALLIWTMFPIVFVIINMISELVLYTTLGKAVMQLCVKDRNGDNPKPYSIVIRNLVKFLGVFNIIFINKHKMLNDRLTDSRVWSKK